MPLGPYSVGVSCPGGYRGCPITLDKFNCFSPRRKIKFHSPKRDGVNCTFKFWRNFYKKLCVLGRIWFQDWYIFIWKTKNLRFIFICDIYLLKSVNGLFKFQSKLNQWKIRGGCKSWIEDGGHRTPGRLVYRKYVDKKVQFMYVWAHMGKGGGGHVPPI